MAGVFGLFSRGARRAKGAAARQTVAGGGGKKIAGGAAASMLSSGQPGEQDAASGPPIDISGQPAVEVSATVVNEQADVLGSRHTFLFKNFPQPRLREQVASELRLSEAEHYKRQSHKFYSEPIDMFPRDDWFYEDHEKEFVRTALGVSDVATETDDDHTSIDHTFYHKLSEFRQVVNDNTRRLLLIICPEILLMILTLGSLWLFFGPETQVGPMPLQWLGLGVLTLVGFAIQMFIYYISFDNTQTRNTLGMNTYIVNKFARIVHNFQEAKRKALNIERAMRMRQAQQLQDEAGTWTLAYHWLATRLMLNGILMRNTTFQISRNTAFYNFGGQIVCLALAALVIMCGYYIGSAFGSPMANWMYALELGVVSIIYIIVTYYFIVADPFAMFRSSLNADQWPMYNTIGYPQSVEQHVGEDKLQIITFRDRNRVETGD